MHPSGVYITIRNHSHTLQVKPVGLCCLQDATGSVVRYEVKRFIMFWRPKLQVEIMQLGLVATTTTRNFNHCSVAIISLTAKYFYWLPPLHAARTVYTRP